MQPSQRLDYNTLNASSTRGNNDNMVFNSNFINSNVFNQPGNNNNSIIPPQQLITPLRNQVVNNQASILNAPPVVQGQRLNPPNTNQTNVVMNQGNVNNTQAPKIQYVNFNMCKSLILI